MNFCPECGTRLGNVPESDNIGVCGIIFTNTLLLAGKLRCGREDVTGLIDSFIRHRSETGMHYRLADAGDYTFQKTGFFGRQRRVSLDAESPVHEYLEILSDIHKKEEASGEGISEYLFIIGGADIIPVPRIRHYFSENSSDKTIDTDLLYAYPYGQDSLRALEDMEAFGYDQMFHIGRLPLGKDAVIEDLAGYLERVIGNRGIIEIGRAYGQTDPNWKKVSANVASDLIENGFIRNLDGNLPEDYYYNRLILSPMVTEKTVSRILDTGADLYYFNLHGGEGAETRGYFGASTPQHGSNMYQAILPEQLTMAGKPNIVVSEACYGGKFIGLDKRRSMVLAALFSNALAFVGSSRIAYGAVDSSDGENGLFSADIIAKTFIRHAMQGYNAGQALAMARSTLLQHAGWGDIYAALTITEFNLYGDPALVMHAPGGNAGSSLKLAGKGAIAPKGAEKDTCRPERIDVRGSGQILGMVREAVDSRIMEIHNTISRHLYSNYSVKPRGLDSAFRLRYGSGKETILFNYRIDTGEGKPDLLYTVSSTSGGKILNVFTTK